MRVTPAILAILALCLAYVHAAPVLYYLHDQKEFTPDA